MKFDIEETLREYDELMDEYIEAVMDALDNLAGGDVCSS